VDLIVERDDGRIVAIETKLATTASQDDTVHLRWLRDRLGDDLLDAVLVTSGRYAYRRPEDGVAVVPAALLGP
jgi:phytoene dehydrogenase-like protein